MNKLLILFVFCSGFSLAQVDTLHIFFDVDSDQLSAAQEEDLKRLNALPNQHILSIHAHCDSSASSGYNEALSKRRLQAVSSRLTSLPKGAELLAHGERKANARPGDLSYDRRVDVVYQQKPPKSMPVEIEQEMLIQQDVVVPEVPVVPLSSAMDQFLQGEEEEVTIQLTILFFNASGKYLPESEPELKALYAFMKDYPEVKAHIRGHICCHGFMEWDDISQARAATVAFYLVDRGIARDRVSYKGYGTSIPFRSPELTEEDRRLNRRVDVVFTKQ
jgi:outer membrane protein OmpA-like peptidoglycan-associated protein